MSTDQKKLQHLLHRTGFGPTPELMERYDGMSLDKVTDKIFADAMNIQDLDILKRPATNDKGEVAPIKAVALILKSQKDKETLNLAWIDRMEVAHAILLEKMIMFWHNHFATSGNFGWLMQVQHNTLRKYALGNFGEMLHAISKDPAMILWLNNHENKKDAPNENFAREVMELFTLGEGNGYTEDDIKQAARAFTGWTIAKTGEFEFNAKVHDDGDKTIFGETGNFGGEDVINMLLAKNQMSIFICRKIYKWFVNHEPDEERVDELSERFRASKYDIKDLMYYIFTSDWFYDDVNIGCLICTPVELIVRMKRLCKVEVEDQQMLAFQELLGQTLFIPPNVAGWKGGRYWINSTSLVQRMHLPKAMIDEGTARLNKRPAFEATDTGKVAKDEKVKVKSDWGNIVKYFEKFDDASLTEEIIRFFIQSPDDRIDRALITKNIDTSTRERKIITTIAAVMQTPEFQIV
ncbi:MAG TPA: DUF1800 domain-containing protein [Bacteroidia bacterium]|jgi:uncharacterized protein (DUF1800 family)|nr:DUF1800 domain-containing protein [Bacteroidia bacterium]